MRDRLLVQVDATEPALALAQLVLGHTGDAIWLVLCTETADNRRSFAATEPLFRHATRRRSASGRRKTADRELECLLAAGAYGVSRLRCPAGAPITDAVFCTPLFQEYSEGVMLLGPLASDFPADLRVFAGTPSVATLLAPDPPAARHPFAGAAGAEIATIEEILGLLAGHASPFGPGFVPPFAAALDADLLVHDAHGAEERRRAAALGAEFQSVRRAMLRSRQRKAHVVDLGAATDPRPNGSWPS